MILQERIQLLARLGEYMLNKEEEWLSVQDRAYRENAWFIPEFIEKAVTQNRHPIPSTRIIAGLGSTI